MILLRFPTPPPFFPSPNHVHAGSLGSETFGATKAGGGGGGPATAMAAATLPLVRGMLFRSSAAEPPSLPVSDLGVAGLLEVLAAELPSLAPLRGVIALLVLAAAEPPTLLEDGAGLLLGLALPLCLALAPPPSLLLDEVELGLLPPEVALCDAS